MDNITPTRHRHRARRGYGPIHASRLRRSSREGAGADLIAHAGARAAGRRAAWRPQCAVPSQPRRATVLWDQVFSLKTSSSIAKGTIQCLHFEILVMKDLLRSWPPARPPTRPTSLPVTKRTEVTRQG